MKDPEWVRRRGLFLAEGRRPVELLLTRSPLRARSLLATPTALGHLADVLGQAPEVEVFEAERPVFDALVHYEVHQRCLAVGERPPDVPLPSLLAGLGAGPARVLLLDRIADPDNVGGLFRNARAFGVGAVVLGPGCAHPLYRKAIRTSLGASLLLPFTSVPNWPEALATLRELGFQRFGLTPAAKRVLPDAFANGAPERWALAVGHEYEGLSDVLLAGMDDGLRIPIEPDVDSVNVATAAAIALHDLDRSGRLRGR